jgi:hypothetical protein
MSNEQQTRPTHPLTTFDFEEFRSDARPVKHPFCVSIYPHGEMRMNRGVYDAMGAPVEVILFFDKKKRVIGIRPSYTVVNHAIRVRTQKDGRPYIPMPAFLDKHKIRPSLSIRFLDPYIQEGTLILDLNRTAHITGSRTIALERRIARRIAARDAFLHANALGKGFDDDIHIPNL